jgi:hypothetical protein
MTTELCQESLVTADPFTVWPCTRAGPHDDGWHERLLSAEWLEGAQGAGYDAAHRWPAVAVLVLRWRDRVPSDDLEP